MINSFKAFIFDFDGVVVDSISSHLKSWNLAVETVFQQTPNSLAKFIGKSTTTIAIELATEFGDLAKAPELARAKNRFLLDQIKVIEFLPGAVAAFNLLNTRKIPWSIGSNAHRRFIEDILARHNISAPIIVGIEDVAKGKPSPEIFLQCAKKMNLPVTTHGDTVVFEDSTHGIAAAVAAGMFPVGITSQHDAETLSRHGARSSYTSLEEAFDHQPFN